MSRICFKLVIGGRMMGASMKQYWSWMVTVDSGEEPMIRYVFYNQLYAFIFFKKFKKQNQDRTTWSPSLCFSSKPSLANPRPSLPSVPQSQQEKCPMLSPAVPLLILSLHTSGCHLPLPLCVVILPCASVPYTKNTFNFLFPKKKEKFHSKLC